MHYCYIKCNMSCVNDHQFHATFHPTISCPVTDPRQTATMFTNSLEVKLLPMPFTKRRQSYLEGFGFSGTKKWKHT